MNMRAVSSAALAIVLCFQSVPVVSSFAAEAPFFERIFSAPIDGFSVRLPIDKAAFRYQYRTGRKWSSWQEYASDGDVLPGEESELIMVPYGTDGLRAQSISSAADIHEIIVSHEPARVRVASTGGGMKSAILSRADWGADDRYLFDGKVDASETQTTDTAKGDNGATEPLVQSNKRVQDCQIAQQGFPDEFKIKSTVKKDPSGKVYRWPEQYSPAIHLLVVHHTALVVRGDPRPPVERLRALYKYHAISRGWGDIGYNFVVDENGQVYEGRAGGKFVVGGHAYCNNVGTIGIVVMGNFEMEQPSQAQAKGLQWLLHDLSTQYGLDLGRATQFHGKKLASPIVAHRDLLSTLCPGYSLYGAFAEMIDHVRTGHLDDAVDFPAIRSSSSSVSAVTHSVSSGLAEGIAFIGRTSVSINPGGKQRLSFTYTAGQSGAYEGKKVGDVRLSVPTIKLWQDDGIDEIPVTKGILLGTDLPAGETENIQLIVQAPQNEGAYWMDIAGLHFTLSVSGRRARTGTFINPFDPGDMHFVHPAEVKRDTTLKVRVRHDVHSSVPSSRASVSSIASFASSSPAGTIRVKLSATASPTITFTSAGSVNAESVTPGAAVMLFARGSECVAMSGGNTIAQDVLVRLQSSGGNPLTIDSVRSKIGLYRGVLECRVIGGALTLIDELPIEEYMAGLAEEPDTEPYEKQRAFAIAARTYAVFYLQPSQRKFPNQPYDASDDPAVFQSFYGVQFAAENPQWIRAVQSTMHEVLQVGGEIIKPPYFSSDDGRTRSPAEAGWKNFLHAEIFESKPDAWCAGMTLRGHGVGMSGCGAKGQALAGRSAEQILQYYYPGTRIVDLP